jgi:hypothetical protein
MRISFDNLLERSEAGQVAIYDPDSNTTWRFDLKRALQGMEGGSALDGDPMMLVHGDGSFTPGFADVRHRLDGIYPNFSMIPGCPGYFISMSVDRLSVAIYAANGCAEFFVAFGTRDGPGDAFKAAEWHGFTGSFLPFRAVCDMLCFEASEQYAGTYNVFVKGRGSHQSDFFISFEVAKKEFWEGGAWVERYALGSFRLTGASYAQGHDPVRFLRYGNSYCLAVSGMGDAKPALFYDDSRLAPAYDLPEGEPDETLGMLRFIANGDGSVSVSGMGTRDVASDRAYIENEAKLILLNCGEVKMQNGYAVDIYNSAGLRIGNSSQLTLLNCAGIDVENCANVHVRDGSGINMQANTNIRLYACASLEIQQNANIRAESYSSMYAGDSSHINVANFSGIDVLRNSEFYMGYISEYANPNPSPRQLLMFDDAKLVCGWNAEGLLIGDSLHAAHKLSNGNNFWYAYTRTRMTADLDITTIGYGTGIQLNKPVDKEIFIGNEYLFWNAKKNGEAASLAYLAFIGGNAEPKTTAIPDGKYLRLMLAGYTAESHPVFAEAM